MLVLLICWKLFILVLNRCNERVSLTLPTQLQRVYLQVAQQIAFHIKVLVSLSMVMHNNSVLCIKAGTLFTDSYFYDHKLQKIQILGPFGAAIPLRFRRLALFLEVQEYSKFYLNPLVFKFSLSFDPYFYQAVPRCILGRGIAA